MVDQVAGAQVQVEVAGAQVVDQVAGAHVDQVARMAGVQVVVDLVARTQVHVDRVAGAELLLNHFTQVTATSLLIRSCRRGRRNGSCLFNGRA